MPNLSSRDSRNSSTLAFSAVRSCSPAKGASALLPKDVRPKIHSKSGGNFLSAENMPADTPSAMAFVMPRMLRSAAGYRLGCKSHQKACAIDKSLPRLLNIRISLEARVTSASAGCALKLATDAKCNRPEVLFDLTATSFINCWAQASNASALSAAALAS
jgi:hypothetical protein